MVRTYEYTFFQRRHKNGQQVHGKVLMIKEMQIKSIIRASLVTQLAKNLPAMQETLVWSLSWEDPMGKGMAIHSSILAWSMGLQREGHDWEAFTFHFQGIICLVRMTIMKKMWWKLLVRMWRKGNICALLMGMKLVQLLCKTVWKLLKKLKIELLYDLTVSLLGIYLKEVNHENNLCPMRDEWIKIIWHVYTSEYYFALKRK